METGRVSIDSQILTDIADSIRSKNGETSLYYPQDMAGKIDDILVPSGSIEITANGTYDVTEYASAEVNTPGITPTGTINITQNGTTDVTEYASASVNVEPDPSDYFTATIPNGNSTNSGVLNVIKKIPNMTPSGNSLDYACYRCTNLIEANISNINSVTTMQNCFGLCSSLTNVTLSGTFASLTNCTSCFTNCNSLVNAPNFDVSRVTSSSNMFNSCSALVNVPQYNFSSSLTQCYNMFSGCTSLVTVPLFTTTNVTRVDGMFNNCSALVNVPQFDFSSMTNANLMGNMFNNCASLSNDSLSNIMNSLVGSGVNSGTMTLANIGLNQTQATYCASLPIWSTLTTAGWTTGY